MFHYNFCLQNRSVSIFQRGIWFTFSANHSPNRGNNFNKNCRTIHIYCHQADKSIQLGYCFAYQEFFITCISASVINTTIFVIIKCNLLYIVWSKIILLQSFCLHSGQQPVPLLICNIWICRTHPKYRTTRIFWRVIKATFVRIFPQICIPGWKLKGCTHLYWSSFLK